MIPKEQAKDLVDKFLKCKDVSNSYYVIPIMEDAKQCALIALDEIIQILNKMDWTFTDIKADYFKEVKQEIEKL